jgi:MFS transporter, SP family, arabinose:H+ symporter
MNKKLILWSVTVGLAGLIFGLDVAVISGAEKAIKELWNLSDLMHGTAIAMALYGTAFGAALGNIPANKIGRKKTLFWIGILFFVSAVGSALVNDVYSFMFFRFVGGLSVGASSVVAPLYIAEIAPSQHRGKMVATFQVNIVTGILLAYLTNYLLSGIDGGNDWRWMLGIVAAPSLLFSICVLAVPETPRWLVLYKKDKTSAVNVLALTQQNAQEVIAQIENSKPAEKISFFQKQFFKPILLAFLLAFFNQLSGINAVIYYAKTVFELAGFKNDAALLASVGIGVVNLIFTFLGWYLIDKFGRRTLMYIGSIGYIVSLALIAYSYGSGNTSAMPVYVFMFIAAHAIGQGAVIWVFISEIFPNTVRAVGTSFGCLTHWVFAALIAQVFPWFATNVGSAYIFGFFCVMMVFQLLFVWKMMPETKGLSLEDMDKPIMH